MNRLLAIAAFCATGAATATLAGEDCRVPMTEWQPRSAVVALAKTQGWTLRSIRIDDGCYEATGTDARGRPIEVKLDPGTLRILEIDDEEDDAEHHRDRHGD